MGIELQVLTLRRLLADADLDLRVAAAAGVENLRLRLFGHVDRQWANDGGRAGLSKRCGAWTTKEEKKKSQDRQTKDKAEVLVLEEKDGDLYQNPGAPYPKWQLG